MQNSKSYALVAYLENESHDRVRTIQEKMFELTGSRKCLDSWQPHLTVGSGIVVPAEKQEEMELSIENFVSSEQLIPVHLKGFGGITNWGGAREGVATPYVLWIDVEMNDQLMGLFTRLKEQITDHYDTYFPRMASYVPHVTVAYGDLSAEGYEKGREYLETLAFEDTVTISHIALVEYTPEQDTEYKRFYFKAS